MPARALVIGLDGFDLRVVEQFGPSRLPHIHGVMRRGAYAAQRSVQPPATLPNWTTFLTGLDPGQHGVFDFTTRKGYEVRFTAGTAREAPTVVKRLDALGLRCACLSFPATWPPERLEHGVFVSGWDAPVAFEADRSFMWPPELFDETVARYGVPTFDDVDEFHADAPAWTERLPETLAQRVLRKTQWAQWLLDKQDWDLFALYFGESDTAAHYLWAHHDAASPRRPAAPSELEADGLARVYEALDQAVGALLETAGGDSVELTLLSDHGFGGSSDKVLYLNRLLAENGLLHFRPPSRLRLNTRLKEMGLRRLPPRLRERLFRFHDAWLPSLLESRVRFGAIDMSKSIAFSDELNYFPGVYLNLRGREPEGIVSSERREEAILRVRAALVQARDPWNGQRVFSAVHRREALFEGPWLSRAPDLLVDLELDDGYSYNLMPSASAAADCGSWRKLDASEHIGKKGRSLPGSHRPEGFFAMSGPRVRAAGRIESHIADATASLLARLELGVPTSFSGRVLWEALVTPSEDTSTLPEMPLEPTRSRRDSSRVEKRLRALGYLG
jgi:predicted AlkP superfamily phosphohydrolase/phosphomutase